MKCISVVSAYLKQTREFIAVILIGMTSIAVGAEPPKLLPLPPIAPGLQLSRLFNDHMVLQRETPLKIWGWAASGEKLTVEFAEQKKSTTVASDGSWQVILDPMPASAIGRTLTVRSDTSNQQTEIKDVLVGEVWLLGGQSNMAFPFFVRNDGFDEAQIDANPQYQAIRCVSTLHGPWADPDWEKLDWVQKDTQKEIPYKREWVVFGPGCLELHGKAFSAFGFFFAKNLYDQLKVPIGLVDTSVGGTLAHYWASAESQKNIPELAPFFKEPVWTPGCLFNSTISPLKNMSLRGAAFYLGENNSLTQPSSIFEPTYRAVISSWRETFNRTDMPFLMIQTGAGGDVQNVYSPSDFNLVQEAQLRIHRTTPNTGFVVTVDDLHTDLHVLRKQSHGQRAYRWAMAEVYAKSVPPKTKLQTWGSPGFKSSETKGNKLILHFDVMSGDELKLTGTPVGFVVAGEDKQFVEAQAELIGKTTVAVWSDKVGNPVAARFGWALKPYINLWTVSGLPVSPFRTDNWPNQ